MADSAMKLDSYLSSVLTLSAVFSVQGAGCRYYRRSASAYYYTTTTTTVCCTHNMYFMHVTYDVTELLYITVRVISMSDNNHVFLQPFHGIWPKAPTPCARMAAQYSCVNTKQQLVADVDTIHHP